MLTLWAYHPSDYRLDTPGLIMDHTKGKNWTRKMANFRYREVLLKLQRRLGTDQFLWCCSTRGCFRRTSEGIDLVEWQLDVPSSHVLSFYCEDVWENIVWSRSNEWERLLIEDSPDQIVPCENVGVLLKLPLAPEWITCHGMPPVRRGRARRE